MVLPSWGRWRVRPSASLQSLVSHAGAVPSLPHPTARTEPPSLSQPPCQSQGNAMMDAVPPLWGLPAQPERQTSRQAVSTEQYVPRRRWGRRGRAHSPLPTPILYLCPPLTAHPLPTHPPSTPPTAHPTQCPPHPPLTPLTVHPTLCPPHPESPHCPPTHCPLHVHSLPPTH